MKYDSVIFDLDGTLLDTLEDLCNSVNFALRAHNFPERSLLEVRSFVGTGVRNLIKKSVGTDMDDETVDTVLSTFKNHYKDHSADKTGPYEGITELLAVLREKGVPTAVVSNKVDIAVQMLVKGYFDGLIDVAIGELDGVNRKPSPDTVYLAMENLGVKNPVYIGDSEIDVLTAKNAGVDGVFVTWGFRDEAQLREAGAEVLVNTAKDLWEVLS